MWKCKICGGEIKLHVNDIIEFEYSLNKEGEQIKSTEREVGGLWEDSHYVSCDNCDFKSNNNEGIEPSYLEKHATWRKHEKK